MPPRLLDSLCRRAPYAAFAAFGVFWGTWGAALPSLRAQAGVTDGQLGTALLFVGVGALPAMLLTGRFIDRFGARLAGVLLFALGIAGFLLAATARSQGSLIAGMTMVGAISGAADVAINTVAGHAEQRSGRPLLTRAHGVFSVAVVGASLAGGAALGAAVPTSAAFAGAAAIMAVLAAAVWVASPGLEGARHGERRPAKGSAAIRGAALPHAALSALPLVLAGLVGALAYASENAHQSWGAVFLTDTFRASPALAATAPATFAAAAAIARLTLAPLSRSHPVPLLLGGGAVATLGSVGVALAPTPFVALMGFAVAALGTATLFPTLLGHTLRDISPDVRGRATSTVSTTAYLGFLLGPAYVGLIAEATDVRMAILGIAALSLGFTIGAFLLVGRRLGRQLVPGEELV